MATPISPNGAVQGQSLAQRLTTGGPLSWTEAQKAVEQIAQGLDYAHTRGWTHGALSPEMIWLSSDLGAITSGWGCSERFRRCTRSGGLEGRAGLAPYLAPERLAGAAPSRQLTSTGWPVCGSRCSPGSPIPATPNALEAQRQAGPLFPASWPEDTPWEIETALERATAAAPTSRYASAIDLAAAPARLAVQMPLSAEERARGRAGTPAPGKRRAGQPPGRRASRLAALSQARKEIEEQVQRAAQASLRLNSDEAAEAPAVKQAIRLPYRQTRHRARLGRPRKEPRDRCRRVRPAEQQDFPKAFQR